ncbi:hypothetical protein Hanom_Chr16g01463881 [Helianthus anomalus]
MGGGYLFPVEPQRPSNHGRSSGHHLNLPVSNPLTSNPEVANTFRLVFYRVPTSNPPPMINLHSLNWAYDYTFAQLQFGGLRIEERHQRPVVNTRIMPNHHPPSNPSHVKNSSQTQELPSWA